MNILFVNSAAVSLWGGGEKWTVTAAAWFRERGETVAVVARPSSRLCEAAHAAGLTVIPSPFGGEADPLSYFRARNIINRVRPDVVVTNFNKESFHFGAVCKLARIPIVARHGFPILRKALHHRWLADSLVSQLIVNADSIRAQYAKDGFDMSHVQVIHNGVRMVTADREAGRRLWSARMEGPLVVGAGRLESQKRFDRFMKVAAEISEAIPDASFAIVGDGPLRKNLEQLARQQEPKPEVSFAGFDSDFAAHIAAADIFLLTSEEEGTPNVVLESMAAGVLVLAMKCGSLPEILSGALSANLFEQDDTKGMGARAVELLNNPTLRAEVAASCRERIEQDFELDVSMKKYDRLLRQVIGTTVS